MAAACISPTLEEPPPPPSSPVSPPSSSSSSTAEETLSLFTTLLGTFQLKEEDEEEENDVVVENRDNQKCESAPSTSTTSLQPRNGRLLQVLLASGDVESSRGERSSFSCLSLDHPHGEHHHPGPQSTMSSASAAAPSHCTLMGKDQAEELAATLMGRSIYATAQQQQQPSGTTATATNNSNNNNTLDHGETTPSQGVRRNGKDASLNISQIPQTLLQHFYESFSVLVDARLRAYASFLAHFGQSLQEEEHYEQSAVANIARKLEILMWLGSHISVDAVVTSFSAVNDNESCSSSNSDCDANSREDVDHSRQRRRVTLPISLEGVLDLTIPHFHFGVRNTTVTICASGTISGDFDDNHVVTEETTTNSSPVLRAVHVNLDTHELLAAMIEEASHIVSVIVDMTNDASSAAAAAAVATTSTAPTRSAASKLLFPKLSSSNLNNKKRSRSNTEEGDQLENKKLLVTLPPRHTIVTPDLTGHSFGKRVPSFTLDADNTNSNNNESAPMGLSSASSSDDCPLTPERCANIVDFAICDIDDKILAGGPTKRPRFGLV